MTAAASSRPAPQAGHKAGPAFARRSFGTVTGNEVLGSLGWLTLQVPRWPGAVPGQFALLQAEDSRCFLGRPLSIAQQESETVSFLIASVGAGTSELCGLRVGERIWVLGPLGNGFDLEAFGSGPGRTVVVAGGVGAAPFPLLLDRVGARISERSARTPRCEAPEVLVLLGFRDASQAAGAQPVVRSASTLERSGVRCRTEIVTEDGSLGRAEKVTDALRREIRPDDRLAVCGPWAMTEAVTRICSPVAGVRAWFSLETGMACGVGSCHGCIVPLADGTNARVCREGPVFSAQVLLDQGLLPASEGAPR
jgi:dihydroorotate dehydrogenase electron transfer subunit